MALRSVTVRKGQSWTNENIDEGHKPLIYVDRAIDIKPIKLYYSFFLKQSLTDVNIICFWVNG